MTLVEFLAARLDEDEAAARHVIAVAGGADFGPGPSITPARALREIEAKRSVLESVDVLTGGEKGYLDRLKHTDTEDARYVIAWGIVRHLATVYADHPDYDEAWRY